MAKIIDLGLKKADDPIFSEGLRITSVRKQLHKEKESGDLTNVKSLPSSEHTDLWEPKDQSSK
jgi:hypothetical protein